MRVLKKKLSTFLQSFGKSFIKGFIVVFTGQSLISVFNMISMVIFLKTLGDNEYGVFIMIQTYVTMLYSIFSFKGFQSLIHYLNLYKDKDVEKSKSYIKSIILLDIISLTLSMIICFIFTSTIVSVMDWNVSMEPLLRLFTLSLLFNFSGTTMGIISAYQKYEYTVISQFVAAIVKLVLYIVCFLYKLDIYAFVWIEIITTVLTNILAIAYSYRILKEHNMLGYKHVKIIRDRSFWTFNISSNLASTIDLPVNEVASFVVNKYLGFEATSTYAIFKRLGQIISKIIAPIGQIIYPEISSKITLGDIKGGFKLVKSIKITMYGIFVVAAICTVFTYKIWFGWFFEEPDKYVLLFIFYLFYQVYIGVAAPIHSIFISLGYIRYTPWIALFVNIIYLVSLFLGVIYLGLFGVILTYTLQAWAMVAIKTVILKKEKY